MTALYGARRGQRGFSLLELLVAFAIMAVSLAMIYRAGGSSVRNVGELEHYQRAALLADSLLNLRDSVPPAGWNDAGNSAGYRWQIQSAPFATPVNGPAVPALHEVLISVFWPEGTAERRFELFTLRPVARPLPPTTTP